MDRHNLVVLPEETGLRLDRYLTSVLPGQSRSHIQRLIKEGKVHIADQGVRPNRLVHAGETIVVALEDATFGSYLVGDDLVLRRLAGGAF